MTSMEAFGPVSVDYFNGRKVEKVFSGDEIADCEWGIEFEGGGLVANYDPLVEMPPAELVGRSLTMTVLGTKETTDGKPSTLLYFGDSSDPRQYVVKLNPIEYAISDESYTQGHLVYAQRSEANMPPTVPDEDADRLAEGPESEDD